MDFAWLKVNGMEPEPAPGKLEGGCWKFKYVQEAEQDLHRFLPGFDPGEIYIGAYIPLPVPSYIWAIEIDITVIVLPDIGSSSKHAFRTIPDRHR